MRFTVVPELPAEEHTTMRAHDVLAASVVLSLALSCGSGTNTAPMRDGGFVFGDGNFNLPEGSVPPAGCPQGNEAIQRDILVPMCGSCHGGAMPMGGLDLVSPGVETRLVNRPSSVCAGQTLIVPGDLNRSFFFRKLVESNPMCGSRMPPQMPLDATRLQCLQAWLAGGLQPTPADAGVSMLPDAGGRFTPGVGTTPPCDDSDHTDINMCPGRDCLECHRAGGRAPEQVFTVAGSVFPSWDSDVTAGVAGVTVRLREIGTNRVIAQTTTSPVGNFYFTQRFTFPIRAEVQRGATVLPMPIDVERGDCNFCHRLPTTALGPGRMYATP